jgi:hypothetical protein
MKHIGEEELVLLYYGEAGAPDELLNHLGQCETCRGEYRTLQRVLNTVDSAPVPERGAEYGAAVWARIQPKVGRRRFNLRAWWVWTPALAGLVMVAFLAGRLTRPAGPASASIGQVRERILLVAVGDHLERSQMVLAELSNAPEGQAKIDISDERQRAENLLDDNRLYRQTARTAGDAGVASVLDDLERVLLEIAHSPSEVSGDELKDLRRQIEERGLLFKVRVLGSRARGQENEPMPRSGQKNKL